MDLQQEGRSLKYRSGSRLFTETSNLLILTRDMFQWRSKVSALWLHARTELHDGMWSLYTETLYSSVHSTSVCFKIQTKKIQRRQKRNGCEIISCPQAATRRPHLKLIIQYIYNYTLFDCQHDEWNDLWGIQEKMEPETIQTGSLLLFLNVFFEFSLNDMKFSFVVF